MKKKPEAGRLKRAGDEELFTKLYFGFLELYRNVRIVPATFITEQTQNAFRDIRGYSYRAPSEGCQF